MPTMQEEAVRNYLAFLNDPESLRDNDAIHKLEGQLQSTDDQIEQLRLHEQISVLRDLPEASFIGPFIEHAKKWAEKEGLSAASFLDMGVERRVLRDAGFEMKGSATRRTIEDVRSWIEEKSLTEFTKPVLMNGTQASPATINRAVQAMLEDGSIIVSDRDDPNHTGRGAKAKLYEVV